MAHFAKLDENNIVLEVLVINNSDLIPNGETNENESYCITNTLIPTYGWTNWKQTSYNTRGGVHYDPATGEPSADQSKALRANYASIGDQYDDTYNIFIKGTKPFNSWALNTTTGMYEAPVANPGSSHQVDGAYVLPQWDDENTRWLGKTTPNTAATATLVWNTETSSWQAL